MTWLEGSYSFCYTVTLNSKYSSKFKYVLKERNNNEDHSDIQILLALPGRVKSMFCFVFFFVVLFYCPLKGIRIINLSNYSGNIKFEENTNPFFNFYD